MRYDGADTVTVAGAPVAAERYRLRVEGQDLTLWYAADDGRWLGLESLLDGEYTLRYELESLDGLTAPRLAQQD